MLIYLNGAMVAADTAGISVWDGGFLYGDGVYTTLRLYGGVPLDLAAHLERLRRHAAALDLAVPLSDREAADIIARLAEANGLQEHDGRLRITVSRGGTAEDPLPLSHLDRIAPTVLMTLSPVPAAFALWAREGIGVTILPPGSARGNLPELKTLNGLPALLALRLAAARGCREAILLSDDGYLLEGAVSNLFLVQDGRLSTPERGDGLLAGRTRERIIKLAAGLSLTCERARLTPADLRRADEAFVASSVREILPIVSIDGDIAGSGRRGPVTALLQSAYSQSVRTSLPADQPPAV